MNTATIFPPTPSHDDMEFPFRPRSLTIAERKNRDLWSFWSPKSCRVVQLIGPLAFMVALQFEFDPNVRGYVERPRQLDVEGGAVELDFWTREPRGLERFWLLVPNDETIEPTTPRREHRRSAALIEAAQRAHVRVDFVFEFELVRRAAEIQTYKRLLPFVQTAEQLPNRDALRTQIRELFTSTDRATLDQVCGALRGFHVADVKAGIVDLIHGGELALANPRELTRFSIIERRQGNEHA